MYPDSRYCICLPERTRPVEQGFPSRHLTGHFLADTPPVTIRGRVYNLPEGAKAGITFINFSNNKSAATSLGAGWRVPALPIKINCLSYTGLQVQPQI